MTDFSPQRRRRLIRKLASVDQTAYGPKQVLLLSVTYHRSWPEDPSDQYDQLRRWHRKVERWYGRIPLFWKKEFQQRDAPHFHFVVFVQAALATTERRINGFIAFARESWIDIVAGPEDSLELMTRLTVRCTRKGSWRSLSAYVSKRMGGNAGARGGRSTGRIWGGFRSKELPISHEIVSVTYRYYLCLRRTFRKIAESGQGRGRRRGGWRGIIANQHVLLPFHELARLLAFLGYRLA